MDEFQDVIVTILNSGGMLDCASYYPVLRTVVKCPAALKCWAVGETILLGCGSNYPEPGWRVRLRE